VVWDQEFIRYGAENGCENAQGAGRQISLSGVRIHYGVSSHTSHDRRVFLDFREEHSRNASLSQKAISQNHRSFSDRFLQYQILSPSAIRKFSYLLDENITGRLDQNYTTHATRDATHDGPIFGSRRSPTLTVGNHTGMTNAYAPPVKK
jgi:hypothetical protein